MSNIRVSSLPKERRWAYVATSIASVMMAGCEPSADDIVLSVEQVAESRGRYLEAARQEQDEVRRVTQVLTGHLRDGERNDTLVDNPGGDLLVGLASCDAGCRDLDLAMFDDTGRELAVDEETDDRPVVSVRTDSDRVRVVVSMADCERSRCAYAVQVLAVRLQRSEGVSGSCFAVSPEGHVMTAYHVVKGADQITVRFSDGVERAARVMRTSKTNDLALLLVTGSPPDWLPLVSSRGISLAQPVFSIGYPATQSLGDNAKFTEGSISSLSGLEGDAAMLQVSIPIQPGSSGSPVVSQTGEVVGIVVASATEAAVGATPQNVNWAVHSHVASLLLDSVPMRPPAASKGAAVQRATGAACMVSAGGGGAG